jgi:hypothetical protein
VHPSQVFTRGTRSGYLMWSSTLSWTAASSCSYCHNTDGIKSVFPKISGNLFPYAGGTLLLSTHAGRTRPAGCELQHPVYSVSAYPFVYIGCDWCDVTPLLRDRHLSAFVRTSVWRRGSECSVAKLSPTQDILIGTVHKSYINYKIIFQMDRFITCVFCIHVLLINRSTHSVNRPNKTQKRVKLMELFRV